MKTNRRQFVKLAILFCAALFCVAGSAPSLQVAGTARVGTLSRPGSAAPTYLFEDNFEGTGYEETWLAETLNGGTIDEDYTTTPPQGSQSLRIVNTGSGNYTYGRATASYTEVYGYFLVRIVADPDANDFELFSFADDGAWDEMMIVARVDSGWKISHGNNGGTLWSSFGGSVAEGTVYHVWWYFKAETSNGAEDGIARLWISTSGTKPGSPTCELTNGRAPTDTGGTVDVISPRARGTVAQEYLFDRMLLDDVAIGDSP